MHQTFDNKVIDVDAMGLVLESSQQRDCVTLQNQHATANIWIANSEHIKGTARQLLPPGGALLMDVKVPTDAIYAQTDIEGAELTITIGWK